MDIIATFMLVFVALTPVNEVETVVVNEYPSLEACYDAIDSYLPDGIPDEPWNWDFVCLQKTENKI